MFSVIEFLAKVVLYHDTAFCNERVKKISEEPPKIALNINARNTFDLNNCGLFYGKHYHHIIKH